MHGHGDHVWEDGRRYIGEWKKGDVTGKGTMYYPDGRIYEGEFENNFR